MAIWPKVGSVCAFYTCHTLGWGRKVRTGRTFNFLPISIKFHARGAKLSGGQKVFLGTVEDAASAWSGGGRIFMRGDQY